MELKKGYKQTEVGVIPEDWEVKKLGCLTTLMTNGFVGTAKTHYSKNDSDVLYIQGYNVLENDFNLTGIKYVTHDFHRTHTKSHLMESDLLTIQTGDVGLTTIVPKKFEGANCHALIITRFKRRLVYPKYVSYYFNSSVGRARLKLIETGTTMKHLNVGDMLRFQIPLPPLKEQTAIAEALSDADALIQSTEKLIAKKRMVKQAAMQQLLSPKEDWEVKRLGQLGRPYGGLSGKSKADFTDGLYPYIPFMNIMKNPVVDINYFDYVNVGTSENQNRAFKGDLFFNGSSETPEEVGMCSVLLNDIPNLFLNSFCFGFRLIKEVETNGLFLSYYFRSPIGRQLFYSSAQGATRYNLSKTNFLKLEISLPNPEEQTRIATILSDMDAEITALEAKLQKYRHIKQGMMQNLLTGKIRLV